MDTNERGVVLSEDYVTEFAGMPKLTKLQKDSKLREIWAKDASPNKVAAWQRIGQGMVGPIQIKPASSTAWANSAFSERKPYPG